MRLYWPARLRPAFDALLDIDDALVGVVARSTQPALAAVKLAWWRERLEALDVGMAPAEPRLQAAARELLPRGIEGRELARLADAWMGLLDEEPRLAPDSGEQLFRLGARLLGTPFEEGTVGAAGRLFARIAARRRGLADSDPYLALPRDIRMERRARPLTALAALAARDLRRGGPPFEPEATPARAWALLRHRVTGRL